MAVTKAFSEAVAARNVRRIRIMMKDSLLVDPTFRDFEEMSKLAANVPGLYDTHDGKELVSDQSAWNDEYMDRQMVEVIWNFSHERLSHLKQVVRVLRPISNKPQPHDQNKGGGSFCARHPGRTDYQKQKEEDARAGRIVKVIGGTVAGAFAGTVIGVVGTTTAGVSAGSAVLICTAVGAAVGGIATVSAINRRYGT